MSDVWSAHVRGLSLGGSVLAVGQVGDGCVGGCWCGVGLWCCVGVHVFGLASQGSVAACCSLK